MSNCIGPHTALRILGYHFNLKPTYGRLLLEVHRIKFPCRDEHNLFLRGTNYAVSQYESAFRWDLNLRCGGSDDLPPT
jgi:hypothetical protein